MNHFFVIIFEKCPNISSVYKYKIFTLAILAFLLGGCYFQLYIHSFGRIREDFSPISIDFIFL